MLPITINILLVIHVLVCVLIVLLVLMQRPKNEGLGAAFGGGMTENLFGAQTTNVLQTFTRWLGAIFFGLTLLLSFLYVKQTRQRSSVQQRLTAPTVVPAATPAPEVPGSEVATPPVKLGEPIPEPALEAAPVPSPDASQPAPAPAPAPVAPMPVPAAEAAKPAPATPAK